MTSSRMPELAGAVGAANDALLTAARSTDLAASRTQHGAIESIWDTVVHITGLTDVGADELVQVGRSAQALVTGLDSKRIEAALLDPLVEPLVGTKVVATGASPGIPVGEGWLGRMLDPLGRPLDGKPSPQGLNRMPLERGSVPLHRRGQVRQPLYTGTLAIDAMFPIGRGQRELILGPDGTGKTQIALDAILRQKTTDVVCVYAAIGRRRSDTWKLFQTLCERAGRFIVLAAAEDQSPALRYLAPYAATTVAEYFRDRGEHVLIVYDDLTAQAAAWRELALLLRRPPGREAYPGDVFYLHARLLERSAQLSPEAGGGSLTALPICRLDAGGLSAYLPTNLVSITDGQIVLSEDLFAGGQRPAIAAGLSVSRVGANAQSPAIKRLARRMRLDYSSFLELEGFARLGTRLGPESEARLAQGRRVRALLQGPSLQPLDEFSEVLRLLLANETKLLLSLPSERLSEFAARADAELRGANADMLRQLGTGGMLAEAQEAALLDQLERLAPSFADAEEPTL